MAVNKGKKPVEVRSAVHTAVKVRAFLLGETMVDYLERLIKEDFVRNDIDLPECLKK